MTIKAYGVPGSLSDSLWSQLDRIRMEVLAVEGVHDGMAVSVVTGTRTVKVTAGRAYAPGVMLVADADQNVVLDANTASTSRIDTVCAQVDWTAARAAYNANGGDANVAAAGAAAILAAASLVVVKGVAAATPVAPKPNRSAGTLWQVPIKSVLVRAGVGQLLASDLIASATDSSGVKSERTCSGTVTLSDGGTDPSSKAIAFPSGMFTAPPRVVVGISQDPNPGAGVNNPRGTDVTATGFNARLTRSIDSSVVCHWIASGT